MSSKFDDLREERNEAMQALLELDCMPAGMELFPAASEEQWSWIRRVIDESDYYICISAGKYGSIANKTGLSYTEMEYRYARDTGKPVIAFLVKDISKLERRKTETSRKSIAKLDDFRELLKQRLCRFWDSPTDLGAKVSRGITQLIKQRPAVGWIRADSSEIADTQEVLKLRRKIEEVEEKLRRAGTEGPPGIDHLARGGDLFEIRYYFKRKTAKAGKNNNRYWVSASPGREQGKLSLAWDDIFGFLAPTMITGSDEWRVRRRLSELIEVKIPHNLSVDSPEKLDDVSISDRSLQTIKIQLRALGLIQFDTEGNWALSPFGDAAMTRLLGVSRQSSDAARD